MSLSPLPPLTMCLLTLALASCDSTSQPTASQAPQSAPTAQAVHDTANAVSGLDDAAIEEFLALDSAANDFVVSFGEPFIGFETRGQQVLVRDHTSGERFATIVPIERAKDATGWTFSGTLQNPWGEEYDFELFVMRGECNDEFSGEISDFTAGLMTPGRHHPHPGCARAVGQPQRWPPGFTP